MDENINALEIAEVTLDGTFERLSGFIAKISTVDERLDGNMAVKSGSL